MMWLILLDTELFLDYLVIWESAILTSVPILSTILVMIGVKAQKRYFKTHYRLAWHYGFGVLYRQ